MTTAANIETASAVLAAAKDVVGPGNWHGKKVFLAAVYEQMGAAAQGWTFAEFGAAMVALHQARLIRLSRADLVEAMPRAMVDASEVTSRGERFHFIRID